MATKKEKAAAMFANVTYDQENGEFRCPLLDVARTVIIAKTLYEMEVALDAIAARIAAMK